MGKPRKRLPVYRTPAALTAAELVQAGNPSRENFDDVVAGARQQCCPLRAALLCNVRDEADAG